MSDLVVNGNIVFDGVGGRTGYYADLGEAFDALLPDKILYMISNDPTVDSVGYGTINVAAGTTVFGMGIAAGFTGDTKLVLNSTEFRNVHITGNSMTSSALIEIPVGASTSRFYDCVFSNSALPCIEIVAGSTGYTFANNTSFGNSATNIDVLDAGILGMYMKACRVGYYKVNAASVATPEISGSEIKKLEINAAFKGKVTHNLIGDLVITVNPHADAKITFNQIETHSCANAWAPTAPKFSHNTFETALDADITDPASSYNVVP